MPNNSHTPPPPARASAVAIKQGADADARPTAWQDSFVKARDYSRPRWNSATLGDALAVEIQLAVDAALERLEKGRSLAEQCGLSIPPDRVEDLLDYTGTEAKKDVSRSLNRVRQVAAKLARQNELNRLLAEFCLDLVQEEAEIFTVTLEEALRRFAEPTRRRGARSTAPLARRTWS